MRNKPDYHMALCKQCKNKIPKGARICSICNSYQDWRSFIHISNTALALLTALISVIGIAAPVLYKIIHTPISEAALAMSSIDGTTLRVVATNSGDAPASLVKAWMDSDYLAPATKIKLRNDLDAIINPGSKLLAFDIIPNLDADESYRDSMEMMSHVYQNKPAPRTEIIFHIIQSDGKFLIQKIPLDAGQLFQILRSNADRCASIKEISFENGCIGSGAPDDERFPKNSDSLPKNFMDAIELRINKQLEANAKNSDNK